MTPDVIVYRSAHRPVDVPPRLEALAETCRRIEASPSAASLEVARTLLMDVGELEAGIVDALCPERDDPHPVERLARTASAAAGRLFGDAVGGEKPPWPSVHHLYQAVCGLLAAGVPSRVSVSVAEGYAYYALYPDAYFATARALAGDVAKGAPAAVVGLRSIGTSLGAAVAAGLEASGVSALSWTVRPRGHPHARTLALGSELTRAWLAAAPRWWFLVDEGPGLSGSSLAAVARALATIGVARDRVVFVPHWRPDLAAFAPDVAAIWARHRVAATSERPAPAPVAMARRACMFVRASDWSGGRWRAALVGRSRDWPAIHPSHERLKWFVPGSTSTARRPSVVKFAGLGEYGRRVAARAEAAANAGFAPPVAGCRDGWMETTFVDGRPVHARHAADAFIDRMAEYLAWRDGQPPASAAADWTAVEQMARVNVRELLGEAHADIVASAFAAAHTALDDRPTQFVDGRVFPHEWIAGGTRYWKTDTAEHADDHFFPGPLDVAWDVAGALAEFDWPPRARQRLLTRYVRLTGDRWLGVRLPICSAAYVAFRAGYAAMASASLSDPAEIARFDVARRRYTAQLQRAVAALRRGHRPAGAAARRAAGRDRPA